MRIEHEVDDKMREEYLKIASKVIYALETIDKNVGDENQNKEA